MNAVPDAGLTVTRAQGGVFETAAFLERVELLLRGFRLQPVWRDTRLRSVRLTRDETAENGLLEPVTLIGGDEHARGRPSWPMRAATCLASLRRACERQGTSLFRLARQIKRPRRRGLFGRVAAWFAANPLACRAPATLRPTSREVAPRDPGATAENKTGARGARFSFSGADLTS